MGGTKKQAADDIIQMLLRAGANPFLKDGWGENVLTIGRSHPERGGHGTEDHAEEVEQIKNFARTQDWGENVLADLADPTCNACEVLWMWGDVAYFNNGLLAKHLPFQWSSWL